MFNNYTSPFCFHNSSKIYTDNLFKAVDIGIDLMRGSLNDQLVQAWQEYVKSILKFSSDQYGIQLYAEYLNFLLTIVNKSPYEQVKESVQKILDIIRKFSQLSR